MTRALLRGNSVLTRYVYREGTSHARGPHNAVFKERTIYGTHLMFYKLQNGSCGDSSVTSVINSEGDESPGLIFL